MNKKKSVGEINPPIPVTPKNHIEEYFKEQEQNIKMFSSRELFTAKPDDIDLKTDLSIDEIKLINIINL